MRMRKCSKQQQQQPQLLTIKATNLNNTLICVVCVLYVMDKN